MPAALRAIEEDGVDDDGVGENGDDGHLDAARGREERVDREDLAQQARPVASTDGRIGEVVARQGRHADAEPLLAWSWTALRDDPTAPPSVRREALARVVRLYEARAAAEGGRVARAARDTAAGR